MTGRLTLSHTYRLHEYLVEAGSLAEDDGLTRLTGHTAQGPSRRTGTDEGVGMQRQLLHACLVTEYGTFRPFGTGVDGQDGELAAFLLQHVHAKLVDAGGFAGAWYTADAHSDRVAAVGQALLNDFLGLSLMGGVDALHQGDGLTEDGDVTLADAFHQVSCTHLAPLEARPLQIGIDDGGLLHAAVHLQACIFGTILGMIHCSS